MGAPLGSLLRARQPPWEGLSAALGTHCARHTSLRCGGAALEAKPQVKKAQPRVPVSLSSGRSQLRINYIIPRWRPLLGYSNRSLSSAYCGVSPEPGIFELGAAQKVG